MNSWILNEVRTISLGFIIATFVVTWILTSFVIGGGVFLFLVMAKQELFRKEKEEAEIQARIKEQAIREPWRL